MIMEVLFSVPRWDNGMQNGSERLLAEEVLHRFWEWAKDADLANLDEDTRKREFREWWESLGIVGVLTEVEPPNLR